MLRIIYKVAPNESEVVILIDTILNAYFGRKYEYSEFSDLPFVCDVSDEFIAKMDCCPLFEPDSLEKNSCNADCIHFHEHEDE